MKKIGIFLLLLSIIVLNIGYVPVLANDDEIISNNISADDVYADFPAQIDKLIEDESHISLLFTYMKPLNESDEATISLTDEMSANIDFEYHFSPNKDMAVFEHVSINKKYKALISETINGISATYSGTITTKTVKADFPEINMPGVKNFSETGIPVENILYRDTEESVIDATVTSNEDLVYPKDERGRPIAGYEDTYISEEPIQNPVLAATADANPFSLNMRSSGNKIYEVQTTTEVEGVITHYKAYYSTENQELFEPGFTFDKAGDFIVTPMYSDYDDLLPSDAFNGAYNMYIEEQYTTLGSSSGIKFQFSSLESESYSFETTGNLDTQISYYSRNANNEFVRSHIYYSGGTGGNAKFTTSLSAGQERFFIVELESGTGGNLTIKVSNNSWGDDGNYFSNPTPFAMNVERQDSLDYGADVDAYSFSSTITETYKFQMNYNDTDLRINPYQVMTGSMGLPYWSMTPMLFSENYNPDEYPEPIIQNLSVQSSTDYIFIVRNPIRSGDSTSYSLTINNSKKPDGHEPNNDYDEATVLNPNGTEFASGSLNDYTLHRGDSDFFKFTLTESKVINISVDPANNDSYFVYLDREVENGDIEEVAMAEDYSSPQISEELDAGIYYIDIFRNGSSSDYTAPYLITWTVEDMGQTVEVEGLAIVQPILDEWDWAACAEMVGKLRNYNEGGEPITKDYLNAVEAIFPNLDGTRVTIAQTASATRYIYSNGDTLGGTKFLPMNNPLYTEADFAALVQANKATIILLSDPNYPNDMTIARYVVVSGVNTTSHQLKIIDPITGQSNWVAKDVIMNGGYLPGSNIKYTAHVLERL